MSVSLKKGDKIWVRGPFGTRHYAIDIGEHFDEHGVVRRFVVHNSKVQGGVVVDPVERFAAGQPITIESRAVLGYEDIVAQRALAYYGRRYDLIAFNCEHLVNLAQTGEHKSQQLRNAAGVAFGAALVALIAGSGGRPRYDRNVRRYRDKQGRFVSR